MQVVNTPLMLGIAWIQGAAAIPGCLACISGSFEVTLRRRLPGLDGNDTGTPCPGSHVIGFEFG
jgi:hypothetical protein